MKSKVFPRLSLTLLTLLTFSLLAVGSPATAQTLHPLGLIPEPGLSVPRATLLAATATALPPSVDLSNDLPLPGDQGAQGSCVAFATGYAYKSFQEKLDNGWTYDTTAHVFSPSYIYNQIHGDNSASGGGSSFSDAFNLLQNQGCATLDVMPYDGAEYAYSTVPTATMMAKAAQHKSASWASLPSGDYNEVRAHLANREVVVIGIPVFPDLDAISFTDPIYDDGQGTSRGNHALAVVGYDDSRRALKFINSWGQSWGLVGYGWISYDLFSRISFASFVMTDLPETPLTAVDTTSSSLDLGTSLPPLMTKDFTVEMWINPGSTQETYADILDFNHRANVGMVFQQDVDNLNQFGFNIGNGSSSAGISYGLTANVWQHIAFQREGTTLRLFVNGTLVATQTGFSGDIYYLPDSLVTVAYNANYGRRFNGTIKGLKFWNYARTQASIQAKSMSLSTFAFDGSTSRVELGSAVVPNMLGNFSIEMWIAPGSTQQTHADILDFNHRENVGIVFQQNVDSLNQFGFSVGNGTTSASITYQLQTGVWQHIKFQRLGTQLLLYVNKSLMATAPCFSGDVYFLPDSGFTVGYNLNYGRYFNGSIYDLKLTY